MHIFVAPHPCRIYGFLMQIVSPLHSRHILAGYVRSGRRLLRPYIHAISLQNMCVPGANCCVPTFTPYPCRICAFRAQIVSPLHSRHILAGYVRSGRKLLRPYIHAISLQDMCVPGANCCAPTGPMPYALCFFLYFCIYCANYDYRYYHHIKETCNLCLQRPRQITAGAFLMLTTDCYA